jgi:Flp pilus assembly protein TadD
MAEDALTAARAEAAAGRMSAAIAAVRRLVAKQPRNTGAQVQLAQWLLGEGQQEQALFTAGRAVEISPRDAEALNTLGYILMRAGRKEEAAGTLGRALEASPTHMAALSNLAGCLRGMGRLDDAAAVFERLLAAHPENEFAYADANLMMQMGMPREAAAYLRKAVAKFPTSVWLKRDLCVALNYTDDASAGEIYHAHAELGQALGGGGEVRVVDADPERMVRVGVVSADLREHSVAWFVRPLLSLGETFEVVVYSGSGKEDEVSRELRELVGAGRWKDVSRVSNPAWGDDPQGPDRHCDRPGRMDSGDAAVCAGAACRALCR